MPESTTVPDYLEPDMEWKHGMHPDNFMYVDEKEAALNPKGLPVCELRDTDCDAFDHGYCQLQKKKDCPHGKDTTYSDWLKEDLREEHINYDGVDTAVEVFPAPKLSSFKEFFKAAVEDLETDDFNMDDYVDHPSGIPDSGSRREFETGSVRDERSGKGRFDLLSPIALLSVAKRLEDGQDKYGERNWEKGQPLMSYLDSGVRHIFKYLSEVMKGKEPTEDHIGAAAWNIMAFIHTQEMIKEGWLPEALNDIPTPKRVGLRRTGMYCDDLISGFEEEANIGC